MLRTCRLASGIFAAFFTISSAAQAAPQVSPLSEIREQFTVPAYSTQEQQLLADQAYLMIEKLFVHRDLKIADFGPLHDPVPRLEDLKKQASSLTPTKFHTAISAVFEDLHDLHTNYIAPAPLSCLTTFVPLRFESVRDAGKDIVVIAGKINIASELVTGLSTGMRLRSIDGVGVESLLRELAQVSGGANPAAMRARAVQMLSMISHSTRPLPLNDLRRFEFERDGSVITRDLPWLGHFDPECLTSSDKTRPFMPFAKAATMAVDDYQDRYIKIFGNPSLAGQPLPQSAERAAALPLDDIFVIKQVRTPAGVLGYIHLKTFYWEDESIDLGTVIEAFRRSVEDDLKQAIGLVIDVRGNPGGNIVMAEKLVQLFAPGGVEPSTVRMVANNLNAEIFRRANAGENRWSATVESAMRAGKRYTDPLAITPISEANSIGQVWFRPVVVLTDATCYSACDLFAAAMQDNNAAAILGIHEATGAGGANVMEHSTFHAIFDGDAKNPFKTLPYQQDMRVAWRQTLRAGRAAGTILEDLGVRPDVLVPLQLADIGGESRELMRQIHQHIDKLQPMYKSGLGVRRGGIVTLNNDTAAQWTESVYGIDTLEILDGDRLMTRLKVALTDTPTAVSISLPEEVGKWEDRHVALIGYARGKKVLRSVRELRWRGNYTAIPAAGLKINFNDGTFDPLHVDQLHGPSDGGWNVNNDRLSIGQGQTYPSDTLARAFLALKLNGAAAKVAFDLGVEAEELNDSLRIYAIDPDSGERLEYFSGSLVPPTRGVSLELPAGHERLDLVFEFESDENWNLAGPWLDNLSVKR